MKRSRLIGVICSALASLAAPSSTEACSRWVPEWPSVVAPNGSLVVALYCPDDCRKNTSELVIELAGDAGLTPLPGAIVASGTFPSAAIVASGTASGVWMAWKPTNGFQRTRYRGRWAVEDPWHRSFEFEARGPELTVDPTRLTLRPQVIPRQHDAGQPTCCPPGDLGGVCGPLIIDGRLCFDFPRVRTNALAAVGWEAPPDLPITTQYLHRLTFRGDPQATEWLLYAEGREFTQRLDQYCYVLELKSLDDGSEFTFPEACVEHPADLELGEKDVVRDPPTARTDLSACAAPPPGLEAEWQADQAALQQRIEDAWCANRDPRCPLYASSCAVNARPAPLRWPGVASFASFALVLIARRRCSEVSKR